MASSEVEHKLVAILSADAVGYSRLMGEDEEATVRTLGACRRRIEQLVDRFRGRVVDSPGDNFLAELPSAVGSVRCAVEIQSALAQENAGLPTDRRMPFRIGIHLGDVMVDGAKIYGDGVNIAARLEGLAAPGTICVSDLVYQQVRRRLDLQATDMGEKRLKNIATPVHAYQIASPVAVSEDSRSPGGSAGRALATRQAVARGPSILEPERRPDAGLFQRRSHPRHHGGAGKAARPFSDRPDVDVHLQGDRREAA